MGRKESKLRRLGNASRDQPYPHVGTNTGTNTIAQRVPGPRNVAGPIPRRRAMNVLVWIDNRRLGERESTSVVKLVLKSSRLNRLLSMISLLPTRSRPYLVDMDL